MPSDSGYISTGDPQDPSQDLQEILHEDVQPETGIPTFVAYPDDKVAITRWKIAGAYSYLTIVSAICLAVVMINPSSEVRTMALTVWGSAAALGGALLRRLYRRA